MADVVYIGGGAPAGAFGQGQGSGILKTILPLIGIGIAGVLGYLALQKFLPGAASTSTTDADTGTFQSPDTSPLSVTIPTSNPAPGTVTTTTDAPAPAPASTTGPSNTATNAANAAAQAAAAQAAASAAAYNQEAAEDNLSSYISPAEAETPEEVSLMPQAEAVTTPGVYTVPGTSQPPTQGSGVGNLFVNSGEGTPVNLFPEGDVIDTSVPVDQISTATQSQVVNNLCGDTLASAWWNLPGGPCYKGS
jgi:hypothetical protein